MNVDKWPIINNTDVQQMSLKDLMFNKNMFLAFPTKKNTRSVESAPCSAQPPGAAACCLCLLLHACHLGQSDLGKLLLGQVIGQEALSHCAEGHDFHIQLLTCSPHVLGWEWDDRAQPVGMCFFWLCGSSFVMFVSVKLCYVDLVLS